MWKQAVIESEQLGYKDKINGDPSKIILVQV